MCSESIIKEREQIQIHGLFDIDSNSSGVSKLVVYNDEYNTFNHVIRSFTSICKLTTIVASTKANIIHTDGKCVILMGDTTEMNNMRDRLVMRGLNAQTEKIEQ